MTLCLVNDERGSVHKKYYKIIGRNSASQFIVRKEQHILLVTYRELKEGKPPLTVVSELKLQSSFKAEL